MEALTCYTAPGVEFTTREELHEHYRTEWHRRAFRARAKRERARRETDDSSARASLSSR